MLTPCAMQRRGEGSEGSAAEAPVQSSWGGKPSFATVNRTILSSLVSCRVRPMMKL